MFVDATDHGLKIRQVFRDGNTLYAITEGGVYNISRTGDHYHWSLYPVTVRVFVPDPEQDVDD